MTEGLGIPANAKVVLSPHGFVSLEASCASDLDVVNAARVSLAKRSDWEWEDTSGLLGRGLSKADEGVLRFLMRSKHGTPFEHTFFRWHVRAPIFVFREWHRHRIGVSINEESARYTQLAGDFYIPARDDIREQHGKVGAYTFERVESDATAERVRGDLEYAYRASYDLYETMLREGIAKEVARLVLPVAIYSQMWWSCNARSLMSFLALRNAPTAQREIRMYAEVMEAEFARIMTITHDAFVSGGRVAP